MGATTRAFSHSLVGITLGVLFGLIVFLLASLGLKWAVYAMLLVSIVVVAVTVHDKERLLWFAFLMSFQIYVSVRLFYGRAGSGGLEFPLNFVLGLVLIAWYLLFTDRIQKEKFSFTGPVATPIGILFFASFLSISLTSERFVGITAILSFIQFYVMYLIGLNFVYDKKRLKFVGSLFVLTLVIQSLIYFIQVKLGYTFSAVGIKFPAGGDGGLRVGGTVGANSAIYAAFVLPLIFWCMAKFMESDRKARNRWFYYGVPLLLGLITLALTLRRGTWAGAAIGLIWFLILGRRHKVISKTWSTISWSIIGLVGLATPALLAFVENMRTGNPLASAFDERVRLMRIAYELIAANPIAGVGPGAYGHTYKAYLTPDLATGWVYRVHNYYLLLAAEIGLIGMFGFILFLWFGYRLCKQLLARQDRDFKLFGLAMGAAILAYAFSIFWEPLSSYAPNALLWFCIGVLAAANKLADANIAAPPTPERDLPMLPGELLESYDDSSETGEHRRGEFN